MIPKTPIFSFCGFCIIITTAVAMPSTRHNAMISGLSQSVIIIQRYLTYGKAMERKFIDNTQIIAILSISTL